MSVCESEYSQERVCASVGVCESEYVRVCASVSVCVYGFARPSVCVFASTGVCSIFNQCKANVMCEKERVCESV